MQEAAMRKSLREAGMTLTAVDAGRDVLPPETLRRFQQSRNRRHHASAAATTAIARAD